MKFAAPIASTTDRLLYDGENAKALAIKLEDDLVAPSPDESSESKPDMSIDKPVKALEERGSHVVEETISRLLEKQGLDGAELNQEQAHLKVNMTSFVRAQTDFLGSNSARPMAIVPSKRSINLLLLRRTDRLPGRATT
jgi:hypothetical protein